ncbi:MULTISPECIES: RNA polymerase alpha subunit C-terminal domain-containing protein [Bacillaceae]|uniref:RNA polymerase alpha subunit C-terminal domain-containing protein n=1 Tax=Evansella alkalicola TaxID=745819 RepID=A0ABS6JN82_9BACI|nr:MULTISPECIES: RNA polymerase alpha subunit C-terminal domain-containing protein [Bacillaceae]MBU9719875.1 RNA polymerase alpha subunit C-terminal domain-containing protein [Bacillus alkalicola]
MKTENKMRVCAKGHKYYKSSDCPSCPTCEIENKPESGFLSKLSSPARSALIHEGIDTLSKLSNYTEKEILKIHGIGPASLPTMRTLLEDADLSFKKQ